jgi:hypothetical protein
VAQKVLHGPQIDGVQVAEGASAFFTLPPFLAALRRLGAPALNPARKFVLPLHLDNGVLLRDLRVGVVGDLAGFDAAADFLPPDNIRAP